jgi:molybdenum cofactor synthesis domain-containing protein
MENRRIGFQADALLAPEQALTLYFAHAQLRAAQTEYVLLEHALRRVLAEPIVSDGAYPAAPRSAMDGFAVRSSETPGRLTIAGEIRMGHAWSSPLAAASAVKIPTGGVVPADADAVVPIEDVELNGGTVEVAGAVPAGDCITPAGSDMRAGETLLEPGRRIGAAELGVLATLGIGSVAVYRRPVIAVISSGDELVELAAQPTAAQVRDSNRWAVAGALEALGAAVKHLPTAPDDPARLEALLREAVATCDGVVLTGGSSVGERDFTPAIIGRLGGPGVIVHGLRVKPGKPTVLASVAGKPIVGLPGNPASALLILEAVAAPIVSALVGRPCAPVRRQARLAEPVTKRAGWTWFLPVRLDEAQGDCVAYPLELRSSSVSLLARASGYLVLDETLEAVPSGTAVTVTRFLVGGH